MWFSQLFLSLERGTVIEVYTRKDEEGAFLGEVIAGEHVPGATWSSRVQRIIALDVNRICVIVELQEVDDVG